MVMPLSQSWQTDRCLQATAGLYYTMLGLTRQSSRRLGLLTSLPM